MMLIHADQERALNYLSTCIDQVNSFGDILQLVIVELIYKVSTELKNPFLFILRGKDSLPFQYKVIHLLEEVPFPDGVMVGRLAHNQEVLGSNSELRGMWSD